MAHEQILTARLRLLEFSLQRSLTALLQATLDEAEELTGSSIGFYHFLDRDQQMLTLQAWSTRTAAEFCKAEGAGSHYPVSQAGVWVDCIQLRCPVIHNDYASLPHRKGLPSGHAQVTRELVVPVFRGEKIVAILGVGNKETDYTEQDIETVNLLADLAWDIAEQKRSDDALHETNIRLEQEIAERQRAQEELTVANHQLYQLNQTLEQRVKEAVEQVKLKDQLMYQQQRQAALGEMINNITHQWKQPLNSLGLILQAIACDIAQNSLDTRALHEDIGTSMELVQFLAQTIDDFRDFFQAERQKADFDVHKAIELTIRLIAAHLENRNVRIIVEPGTVPFVRGYKNEFCQVLLNLVGNALDAFAERTVRFPAIHIGIARQGETVIITVSDNGGGIPLHHLPHIFEHHFTTKAVGKGSGIGLSMSKAIVEQHFGGHIRAENRNNGALFSIEIPMTKDQLGYR